MKNTIALVIIGLVILSIPARSVVIRPQYSETQKQYVYKKVKRHLEKIIAYVRWYKEEHPCGCGMFK